MFNPNAKIKKILGTYGACAYVHSDGVVILEKKEIAIENGTPTYIDVWHLIPCDIHFRAIDYGKDSTEYPTIDRIVVQDTSLIANGFDRVEVIFNNSSNATREKGLTINKYVFTKGLHRWSVTDLVDILHCAVSVQPDVTRPYNYYGNPETTILQYVDRKYQTGNSVVIYGELPQPKVEVLQLSVSN